MTMPAQTNLLVVDDGMLNSMMNDPRYLAAFPCLAAGQRQLDAGVSAPGCGRCGKKGKNDVRRDVLLSVRNCITGMAPQQRAEFKRLANARQVRFMQPRRGGGITRITF